MGNIVAFRTPAETVQVKTQEQEFIDEAYRRLVDAGDFEMRPGQPELSLAVATAFLQNKPLAAEAHTGTGKTVAYLIGALAAAEQLSKTRPVPVFVATATVGLQTQVVSGDLPRLARAGILKPEQFALIKGRGRYFCPVSAERYTEGKEGTKQTSLLEADTDTEESVEVANVQDMLEAWETDRWTGDLDAYGGSMPSEIGRVAASAHTCTGQKCPRYETCPFFLARKVLSSAQILVGNHDLWLSDMLMNREGSDPLVPGSHYLLVVDEAHHVPAKALEAAAAELHLPQVLERLTLGPAYQLLWGRFPELKKLLSKGKLEPEDLSVAALRGALEQLQKITKAYCVSREASLTRFQGGAVPGEFRRAIEYAEHVAKGLVDAYQRAQGVLRQSKPEDAPAHVRGVFGELMYLGAQVFVTLQTANRALKLLLLEGRYVRWAESSDAGEKLAAMPLRSEDVLLDLVWSTTRVRAAFVSATLTSFGRFDHFQAAIGSPLEWLTLRLDPVLPYHKSTLCVVDMKYAPRQDTRAQYEEELLSRMPEHIDESEGTLVLFPSKALMRRAVPHLRRRFGNAVVAQGERGFKQVIEMHSSRIAEGKGSILCGLATMAEGLDLPGRLCTHVVICSLPFDSPTQPLEQEFREELGDDYFGKRALPRTLIRLTQMTGRLVRRMTDQGRITVFDNRLAYTRWGLKLKSALPEFQYALIRTPLSVVPATR